MKVSVDLDGVLCSFTSVIVNKFLAEVVPANYQPKDWDYTDVITKEGWDKIWEEIRGTTNFWLNMPEYSENITILRDFIAKNPEIEVYFVTSRNPTAGSNTTVQTCQWLKQRELWPRNGSSSVIVVRKPELKRQVIEALDIKFSIDDKPETVNSCLDILGHQPYLLSRSWNRGNNWYAKVPVVFSMEEFLGHVRHAMVRAVGE